MPDGAGRSGLRPAQLIDLGAQRRDLVSVGTWTRGEEAAETEKQNSERRDDDRGNR